MTRPVTARRWRGDKGKEYGNPQTMEYQTDPPVPRRECKTETGEDRDSCYGKREIEFKNPAQYAREWREMNIKKAYKIQMRVVARRVANWMANKDQTDRSDEVR